MKTNLLAKIMLALAILTPTLASAAPGDAPAAPAAMNSDPQGIIDLFLRSGGDAYTNLYLHQIFGPLFVNPLTGGGTGDASILASIIGYFNMVIVVVAAVLFFVNATSGIVQSAHEGEFLGKRWSSLWAPFRLFFAAVLLTPIYGVGGYNMGELGIGFLTRGATAVASNVWSFGAQRVIGGVTPITAPPSAVDGSTARNMYMNAACTAYTNWREDMVADITSENRDSVARNQVVWEHRQYNRTISRQHSWGNFRQGSVLDRMFGAEDDHIPVSPRLVYMSFMKDEDGNLTREGLCGSVAAPPLPDFLMMKITSMDQVRNVQDVISLFTRNTYEPMARLQDDLNAIAAWNVRAGGSAGESVVERVLSRDETYVPRNTQLIAESLAQANASIAAGNQAILQKAVGSTSDSRAYARDRLVQRITGDCVSGESGADGNAGSVCYGEGWIGAGSWYMTITRMNGEIASLFSAKASANLGADVITLSPEAGSTREYLDQQTSISGIVPGSTEERAAVYRRYERGFAEATTGLAAMNFDLAPAIGADLREGITSDSSESRFGTFLSNSVIMMVKYLDPARTADPMVGVVDLGNLMMDVGGGLTFGAGAAAGAASVIAPAFSDTAGKAFSYVASASAIIITAGAALAIILPMTPFFFWVMAVTGYFLLVVEAVIAVNLWAISHMRLDGEGISGPAGERGWLMLLTLLMTPILMVFGFLVSMMIFRITTDILSTGITQAMIGVLSGGLMVKAASLVIVPVMLVAMYIFVIERSFSLVSDFPGRVMRWMGSDASLQTGDVGSAKAAMVAGSAAVYKGVTPVVGNVGRGVGSAAGSLGNGMTSGYRRVVGRDLNAISGG